MTWRDWRDHPERVWLRNVVFQAHFWSGALLAVYIFAMSVTGSLLVFRNELAPHLPMEAVVALHADLASGESGRVVNGIGAVGLVFLCASGAIIWWPGIAYWRRSLTVEWRARFPRINWDLHSALGFWFFVFVLMWGVSGAYLALPRLFDVIYRFDPHDRMADSLLFGLSQLHFGRFNPVTEVIWTIIGLVPALLAFTGTFICCRRVMLGKPSNPRIVGEPNR